MPNAQGSGQALDRETLRMLLAYSLQVHHIGSSNDVNQALGRAA